MKSWKLEQDRYDYELMNFDDYKVRSTESIIFTGTKNLFRQQKNMFGYYILDGEIEIDGDCYSNETFLLFEHGTNFQANITKHLHVIYVETMMPLKDGDGKPSILIEDNLPFNRPVVEKSCCSKYFMTPDKHGAKIQVSTYTKGATTPLHTHSMAHGFYVLEGMLHYWVEDQYQILGPGEFVVVPKLVENQHYPVEGCDYTKYFFIGDDVFDFLVDGEPYKPF